MYRAVLNSAHSNSIRATGELKTSHAVQTQTTRSRKLKAGGNNRRVNYTLIATTQLLFRQLMQIWPRCRLPLMDPQHCIEGVRKQWALIAPSGQRLSLCRPTKVTFPHPLRPSLPAEKHFHTHVKGAERGAVKTALLKSAHFTFLIRNTHAALGLSHKIITYQQQSNRKSS